MTVKERLIEFIKIVQKSDKPNISKFEQECDLGNSYVKSIRKSVGEEGLKKIKARYPELNEIWLLHGKIDMPKSASGDAETIFTTNYDKVLEASMKDPSIQALIESNRLMAQAHLKQSEANLKQVENNSRLIALLEKRSAIEGELKQTQIEDHSRLSVVEKLIRELGVKAGFWPNVDDGRDNMNKALVGEMQVGKVKRTRRGADSSSKNEA